MRRLLFTISEHTMSCVLQSVSVEFKKLSYQKIKCKLLNEDFFVDALDILNIMAF
jgi:hypothetical protein